MEEMPEKLTPRIEALIRKCVSLFDTYSTITGNVTKEAVIAIYTLTEPSYIADYIIQNMYLKPEKKQLILETAAPVKRLSSSATSLCVKSMSLKSSSALTSV